MAFLSYIVENDLETRMKEIKKATKSEFVIKFASRSS
jgi:hypothetical protein